MCMNFVGWGLEWLVHREKVRKKVSEDGGGSEVVCLLCLWQASTRHPKHRGKSVHHMTTMGLGRLDHDDADGHQHHQLEASSEWVPSWVTVVHPAAVC